MSDTYRILGTKLDVEELYVDATVTDVTIEGVIHLEEDTQANPRTWTADLDTFHEWQDENNAAKRSALADPDHVIWEHLSGLYEVRTDNVVNGLARNLETSASDIFSGAIYEQLNQ